MKIADFGYLAINLSSLGRSKYHRISYGLRESFFYIKVSKTKEQLNYPKREKNRSECKTQITSDTNNTK